MVVLWARLGAPEKEAEAMKNQKAATRARNEAWALAIKEGRVLRLTATAFKSYPTVDAADAAYAELRATGLPVTRVIEGAVKS